MKQPKWIKNTFKEEVWFYDGDEIAVAVLETNNKTGEESWSVAAIRISCDEDHFEMIHLKSDEPYDDWDWFNVDYFMRLDSHGPLTKKQFEALR